MRAEQLPLICSFILVGTAHSGWAQSAGCSPPCQNNGRCQQEVGGSTYFCNCIGTGYSGIVCNGTSPTRPSPAPSTNASATPSNANGISCPVSCKFGACQQEYNSNQYYCACNVGYRGSACDVAINASSPAPSTSPSSPSGSNANGLACPVACYNGTCTQTYNSEIYYCACNAGVSGPACNVTAAAPPSVTKATNSTFGSCPVPCSSNGFCTQEFNSPTYFCQCKSGFSGAACSVPAAPAPAVASPPATTSTNQSCPIACSTSNGKCEQQFNSDQYYCLCNSGFTGAACTQTASRPPAASTTGCPVACVNGKCTQDFNSNSYYCQCNSGFSGSFCNSTSQGLGPGSGSVSASSTSCPLACNNGTCRRAGSGDYYCECRTGYQGTNCNVVSGSAVTSSANTTSSKGSGLSGGIIFVIVLCSMIGALAAGVAGYFIWKRQRKPTFVKFQEGGETGIVEISPKSSMF